MTTGLGASMPTIPSVVFHAATDTGISQYVIPIALTVGGVLVGRYGDRILRRLMSADLGDDARKKLRAKRINEHLKLFATFCNTVGAATIGAAFLVPYLTQHQGPPDGNAIFWASGGAGLHMVGQLALIGMRSEG